MLNELEELTVCSIKNFFTTCLFEIATETGGMRNIPFHLLRKCLNKECEVCSQAEVYFGS